MRFDPMTQRFPEMFFECFPYSSVRSSGPVLGFSESFPYLVCRFCFWPPYFRFRGSFVGGQETILHCACACIHRYNRSYPIRDVFPEAKIISSSRQTIYIIYGRAQRKKLKIGVYEQDFIFIFKIIFYNNYIVKNNNYVFFNYSDKFI